MENLTTTTFKEKILDYTINKEWNYTGEKPAIIDFYADWCQPCKILSPILEDLSKEYPEIDFYKVNTETEPELAMVFQVRSIPTLFFIPVGGAPQMTMGALPKFQLVQMIQNVFGIKK